MKTTRPNCFETNSSSTHSLTLHAPSSVVRPSSTFLANEEGFIDVELNTSPSDCDSSMSSKLNFLLSYAYVAGDQEKFDQVKRVVETFTKIPVRVNTKVWDYYPSKAYIEKKDLKTVNEESVEARQAAISEESDADEAVEDLISDSFSYFTDVYGNGSASELMSEANRIFASDEMVLTFIFSNSGGFSTEAYYDG